MDLALQLSNHSLSLEGTSEVVLVTHMYFSLPKTVNPTCFQ